MGRLNPPRLLSPTDNLDDFSSGSEPLDFWLREKARLASQSNTAKVYVLTSESRLIGFFALAASSALREELPRNLRRDMPRHRIPMILLARLAVDSQHQGQGVGTALVSSALAIAMNVSGQIGAIGLATNAKDLDAKAFYSSLGFQAGPNDDALMIFPLSRLVA